MADQDDPRQVWAMLCELVFDNMRRREAAEAVGLSFGRIRAIRRIARRPMSMGDLAASLVIDPPNASAMVNDLEDLGLAKRTPHPTDRRTKLVSATKKGISVARRADEILSTPPSSVSDLDPADLRQLGEILQRLTAG